MMDDDTSFLETLKPGDKVFVRTNGFGRGFRLERRSVERLTKTQIVLSSGDKYRRESGRQVGHLAGPRIVESNEANRDQYTRQKNRETFMHLTMRVGRDDDKLTDGEIAAMLHAYRRHRNRHGDES